MYNKTITLVPFAQKLTVVITEDREKFLKFAKKHNMEDSEFYFDKSAAFVSPNFFEDRVLLFIKPKDGKIQTSTLLHECIHINQIVEDILMFSDSPISNREMEQQAYFIGYLFSVICSMCNKAKYELEQEEVVIPYS